MANDSSGLRVAAGYTRGCRADRDDPCSGVDSARAVAETRRQSGYFCAPSRVAPARVFPVLLYLPASGPCTGGIGPEESTTLSQLPSRQIDRKTVGDSRAQKTRAMLSDKT
jgi:hypothetical protein